MHPGRGAVVGVKKGRGNVGMGLRGQGREAGREPVDPAEQAIYACLKLNDPARDGRRVARGVLLLHAVIEIQRELHAVLDEASQRDGRACDSPGTGEGA